MISFDDFLMSDSFPIYLQIIRHIKQGIAAGVITDQEEVPSRRALSALLGVNPNTIQRAYNQLEQDGYLYTVSGRGSFVAPEGEWREGKKSQVLTEWIRITQSAREAGVTADQLTEELHRIYEEGRA